MSEWQPISTAPRDGTVIILFRAHAPFRAEVVAGFWDKSDRAYPWRFAEPSAPEQWNAYSADWGPTHWAPLPEPPR